MAIFSDNLTHLSFPNAASDCCVYSFLFLNIFTHVIFKLKLFPLPLELPNTVPVEKDEEEKMVTVDSSMDPFICGCKECSFLKLCMLYLTSRLYLPRSTLTISTA